MKKILAAISLLCLAGQALAQSFPVYTYPSAGTPPTVLLQCDTGNANCTPSNANNPLIVSTTGGGSGATSQRVQGPSAAGATAAGDPVPVGGTFIAGTITGVSTGQRAEFKTDDFGSQRQRVVGTLIAPSSTLTQTIYCQGASSGSTTTANLGACAVLNHVWDGTNSRPAAGDASGAYVVEVPSASTNAGVAISATTAVNSALVVKASAGNLYGYNVVSGASAGFVLIFNATTAPADGAVTPARCIPLAANTGIEVDLRGQPTFFTTGIVIVFSTTGCFTKTASVTAFIAGDAK